MEKIIIETTTIDGIPILTLKKENLENGPIIFYLHGFTSDKRQGFSFGYELAKKGFYFVALDAKMHGERFDPKLEKVLSGKADLIYPLGSGLDGGLLMYEIILQTGKDIDLLIAHFKAMGAVHADAIGLAGYSMGGYAAFFIAAHNSNIQTVVPIAGIPAFEARWKDVVLEASTYPEWSKQMEAVRNETESRTRLIEEIDPFEKLVHFYPKPLLVLCGDTDTDSPKKYSVDLYRKLKPVYQAYPDRLQLRIYDEVGHQLAPPMIQDACDWFDQFLLR